MAAKGFGIRKKKERYQEEELSTDQERNNKNEELRIGKGTENKKNQGIHYQLDTKRCISGGDSSSQPKIHTSPRKGDQENTNKNQ